MKTKQLPKLSSFKSPLEINNITKAIAIGGLAMGAAAMLPAAPAGAVLLNSGNLTFSGGTADFFTSVGQTSYTVNFNPSGLAFVSNATGAFSSVFAPNEVRSITPSAGTFSLVSGNTFSLGSALNFNFPTTGVSVSIDSGSIFTRTFNNGNAGLEFSASGATGRVINADGTVNLQSLAFSFSDNPAPGGSGAGSYGVSVSPVNPIAAVPEPFTVIGTLVGGSAALRMRKKLANAAKK